MQYDNSRNTVNSKKIATVHSMHLCLYPTRDVIIDANVNRLGDGKIR